MATEGFDPAFLRAELELLRATLKAIPDGEDDAAALASAALECRPRMGRARAPGPGEPLKETDRRRKIKAIRPEERAT